MAVAAGVTTPASQSGSKGMIRRKAANQFDAMVAPDLASIASSRPSTGYSKSHSRPRPSRKSELRRASDRVPIRDQRGVRCRPLLSSLPRTRHLQVHTGYLQTIPNQILAHAVLSGDLCPRHAASSGGNERVSRKQ